MKSVGESVGGAGEKAGEAAKRVAGKAKVPLIATGAALAGAASGVAVTAMTRSKRSKFSGVKMAGKRMKPTGRNLAKTADRVALAGEQIGRISSEFRELQGTANRNGQKRSPIEVALQALTTRRE